MKSQPVGGALQASDSGTLEDRPSHEAVDKDEILKALSEILKSDLFSRAQRMSQLLSYLVKSCLDGEGFRLNEYTIGLSVFNRNSNIYSPGDDPIVRVQVGRLRQRLKEYYLYSPSCSVRFEIPLGSYHVNFFKEDEALRLNNEPRIGLEVICINPHQQTESFAQGLLDELSYHAYHLFSSTSLLVTPVESNYHEALDYLITARIRFDGEKLRLTAKITACRNGRLLWVEQLNERSPFPMIERQQEIAELICQAALQVLPTERSI
jgi:hypothetical protein